MRSLDIFRNEVLAIVGRRMGLPRYSGNMFREQNKFSFALSDLAALYTRQADPMQHQDSDASNFGEMGFVLGFHDMGEADLL